MLGLFVPPVAACQTLLFPRPSSLRIQTRNFPKSDTIDPAGRTKQFLCWFRSPPGNDLIFTGQVNKTIRSGGLSQYLKFSSVDPFQSLHNTESWQSLKSGGTAPRRGGHWPLTRDDVNRGWTCSSLSYKPRMCNGRVTVTLWIWYSLNSPSYHQ